MEEQENFHPFELFPRAYLYNKITRKQFFDVLRAEFSLYANNGTGGKIPELGILEDTALYDMIPRILPNVKIVLKKQKVWTLLSENSQPFFLFDIDTNTLHVFNLINGFKSLKEIAQSLSDTSGLSFGHAFLFTRGLFLTLVKAGVCLPINNPQLG